MTFKIFSLLLIWVLSGVLAQDSSCGFVGGFALRTPSSSCPADAPLNCGIGIQPRCCPSGFTCVGGKYCCQNGQDCTNASEAHPQCPVSTWSIWAYNSNGSLGWCCEPNYFGFAYLDNSGVGCQLVGQTIDTATYHTVSQLQAKPVTCSSSSSSTSGVPATLTTSTSSTSSQAFSGSSAASTSASSTASSSQYQSSSQTSASTSTASNTSSSTLVPAIEQNKSSSFGTGAIAGVAVAGVAVVVLLVLAAWYIGRRSSKRKAAAAAAAHNPNSSQSAYDKHQTQWPQSEKKAVAVQELPYYDPAPVHEIGNHEPRATYMPGRQEMP